MRSSLTKTENLLNTHIFKF